jgi:hypothetical protein
MLEAALGCSRLPASRWSVERPLVGGRASESAAAQVSPSSALAPQMNAVCLCSTPRPRQRRFRRLASLGRRSGRRASSPSPYHPESSSRACGTACSN